MKTVSTIKNPLTIIAVFASVTEIGGTGVLPFLEPENQRLYIWFLILFPFSLVGLFFGTLIFKRHALYAPSDWQDEDNFFRDRIVPASDEDKNREIRAELETSSEKESSLALISGSAHDFTGAIRKDGSNKQSSTSDSAKIAFTVNRNLVAHYRTVERFALSELTKKLGIHFLPNQQFASNSFPSTILDGLAMEGPNVAHVAEVKWTAHPDKSVRIFREQFAKFRLLKNEFERDSKKMVLHLALVSPEKMSKKSKAEIVSAAEHFGLQAYVHSFEWSDMEANQ